MDKDCFTYQDVLSEFSEVNNLYLSKVLSVMVAKGMLIKLKRNLYYIVPSDADPATYIPDWHLVARHLMKGKDYYIGYYSAMQIHGLTTQPGLTEIIVTNLQVKPSSKMIRGVKFQYVYHIKTRFFGFKDIWINQYEKVSVSDLEKTLVDALTRPHLCGGMIEAGKAFYEAREKIDHQKLFEYFHQNDNKAAIKRYLFLIELFGLAWSEHHEKILKEGGSGFPLLDTTGPDEGRKASRFGLKINIDPETIRNAIHT